MSVVPLTIIVGLCLVLSFVVFFLREHARGRVSSAERDSLLPLAEENPILALAPSHRDSAPHGNAAHRHGDAACGCHDGSRQPCPGCLRR